MDGTKEREKYISNNARAFRLRERFTLEPLKHDAVVHVLPTYALSKEQNRKGGRAVSSRSLESDGCPPPIFYEAAEQAKAGEMW